MTIRLSLKDITSVRYFVLFLNVFLAAPWYNFQQKVPYRPHVSKIYGFFLICVETFFFIHAANSSGVFIIDNKALFTEQIIGMATFCNDFIFRLLTISKSCFWDVDKWRKLLKNLCLVDHELGNCQKEEASFFKNFYFGLFVKQFVFLVVMMLDIHLDWEGSEDSNGILWTCVNFWAEFVQYQVLNLILTFIKVFEVRYDDLRMKLKKCSTTEEIQTVAGMFRILGESVQEFSGMFGYQIIIIFFSFLMTLIKILNFIYTDLFQGKGENVVLVADIVDILFTTYCAFSIILSMDSALQKAKSFVNLCHQMQERNVTEITTMLVNHSRNFMPEFTAAGFLTISRNFLLALVGNVATYFIITIQMNQSDYQKRAGVASHQTQ